MDVDLVLLELEFVPTKIGVFWLSDCLDGLLPWDWKSEGRGPWVEEGYSPVWPIVH